MKDLPQDKLVYTSDRPFWNFLISIPLYYFMFRTTCKTVELFYAGRIWYAVQFLVTMFFLFVCAAGITFTKKVYTNSRDKNVRFNFTLFGIPLCKDTIFKNVQYVSVYKNHTDRDFEVNIYLTETKKKSVSVYLDSKQAFKLAINIATGLNVDLLDATEKGNFKWIEKDNIK
ncbi:hypothetical protein [[Flexibacter] sp. ATCC 35103]|uniref:hypothetical protein n=1 Tax=[Flexibacter] sp. ATCC 35103 TaxID=1937528 RepID=UPI0009CC62D0|nr:hypothetical protein [[Flexibacter] sp. ATCC 35103]OMQ12532.1 hypothetical protein BXU01_06550 [[Flexibacter] sp. ATCC 35103]